MFQLQWNTIFFLSDLFITFMSMLNLLLKNPVWSSLMFSEKPCPEYVIWEKLFYLKSIPLENKIYFRGWGTPKLLMGVSTHMSCGKLYWDILQSTARSTACKELARNRIYFKGARLHHKGSPRNISIGNYLLDGYRIFWRRVMRFLLVMIVQDCISGTLLSIGPFTWHKEFRASIKIPHVLFILISRFCWLYWSK